MIDSELIIADIIQKYTGIPSTRINIVSGTYEAPKDKKVYITIRPDTTKVVGISKKYNQLEDAEEITSNIFQNIIVEVCSRNTEADQYHIEAAQSINSQYAIEQMEKNSVRIFRPQILNLSAIEGFGTLRRYRLTFTINKAETKKTGVWVYTEFPSGGIENE
jgi:hypothetical protein